ncbi:MAG: L-threonylcarbamoyladenylate synthase [Erythrobacter sp.]|nr:L-threonylcarbamoyladenylate synthase [Erythrobacter sp.]
MRDKVHTRVRLADPAGLDEAAAILERGGLVAVPTETVYGLAARADSAAAVARIFEAKGRPSFNPLIVHVKSLARARELARFPPFALHLAERHWPGPLTLVLERGESAPLAPAVSAGLPSVALRQPAHPAMAALLGRIPFELAAPSANRSGFISPTSAAHVLASLDGRIDLVLDAGAPCESGIESTILAVRPDDSWEELRPGPLDPAALLANYAAARQAGGGSRGIEAPGQLASHYAPGKPVRLEAQTARADEFHIGFGGIAGDCNLSASGDLAEAAAGLYAALHAAAADPRPAIAVAPIPQSGIGRAINDRLRRAATAPE